MQIIQGAGNHACSFCIEVVFVRSDLSSRNGIVKGLMNASRENVHQSPNKSLSTRIKIKSRLFSLLFFGVINLSNNAYQRSLSVFLSALSLFAFALRGFPVVLLRKIRETALSTMMVRTAHSQMLAVLPTFAV